MDTMLGICLIMGYGLWAVGILDNYYYIKAVSLEQYELEEYYTDRALKTWGCGLVCIIVASLYMQFVHNNGQVWAIPVAYTAVCIVIRIVALAINAIIRIVRSIKTKVCEK